MRKSFMKMYPDEQREYLAQFLADWRAAEFIPLASAKRFYRQVRILAGEIGVSFEDVMRNLESDASILEF